MKLRDILNLCVPVLLFKNTVTRGFATERLGILKQPIPKTEKPQLTKQQRGMWEEIKKLKKEDIIELKKESQNLEAAVKRAESDCTPVRFGQG